jgi:hypothetical protein
VITGRGQVLRRRKALPPCRLRYPPSRPVAEQSSQAGSVILWAERGAPNKTARALNSSKGIGHTIPYLIPEFYKATTTAAIVAIFELLGIAFIQRCYTDTPTISAAAKIMFGGGGLVLATGIMIGNVR